MCMWLLKCICSIYSWNVRVTHLIHVQNTCKSSHLWWRSLSSGAQCIVDHDDSHLEQKTFAGWSLVIIKIILIILAVGPLLLVIILAAWSRCKCNGISFLSWAQLRLLPQLRQLPQLRPASSAASTKSGASAEPSFLSCINCVSCLSWFIAAANSLP